MSVNKYDKINNRLLPFAGNGGGGGSAGIRYDENTDTVQLFYDGEWVDWKTAGLAYPIGTETVFDYTGDVQEFTVPASGRWKLECWGAQGSNSGGSGGYAYGEVVLESEQLLKIVVGGQTTGYNGGGSGGNYSGGGCTHIAQDDGNVEHTTLLSYGSASIAENYVYVVGGGGGAKSPYGYAGGIGGGENGTQGGSYSNGSYYATGGTGGTQSSGGSAGSGVGDDGQWNTVGKPGSFAKGGDATRNGTCAAGGGGWYGGGSGGACSVGGWRSGGGGGGSSWYGGCLTGTTGTTSGTRSGDGKAKLTYLGRA